MAFGEASLKGISGCVFNPSSQSKGQASLAVYRRHEWEEATIWAKFARSGTCHVDTLSFVIHRRTGQITTVFYKRLVSMLSEKRGIQYSKAVGWLRCCLRRSILVTFPLTVYLSTYFILWWWWPQWRRWQWWAIQAKACNALIFWIRRRDVRTIEQ